MEDSTPMATNEESGPSFRVLSVANARLMTTDRIRTASDELSKVAWFSRLGQPSEWDQRCHRLHCWEEWPGPEAPGPLAMALQGQAFRDAVVSPAGLDERFDEMVAEVVAITGQALNLSEEGDAWDAPTTACWAAGWCAARVTCFEMLSLDLPPDLTEQWLWFAEGHWPAGYEVDPAIGPQRLLVL